MNNKQPKRRDRTIGRIRALRFERIRQAIATGKYPNATQLAKMLETSARAIRDDIHYMRLHLGAEIDFDWVKNGYFCTKPTDPIAAVHATEAETTAVLVAQNAAQQFQGTFLDEPFQNALKKLTASLPEHVVFSLEKWKDVISIHTRIKPLLPMDHFQTLAEAAANRERLKMTYRKPEDDAPSERFIDPYRLAQINNEWFLFAYDLRDEEHKTFAPIRILQLERTGKRFRQRKDFCLTKRLAESFLVHHGKEKHEVVVWFAKKVAAYIREKEWPCQQSQCVFPDGGVELRLKVSSLGEVQRWLMQWGGNAIVQQPAQLKEMVVAEAKKIVAAYGA